MSETTLTHVTGGSHGIAVQRAQARLLAGHYDRAGDTMRGWAGASARVLADGDLLESALLSPLTFAEAEAAVLATTAGPDGVLAASAQWETDAVLIRAVVTAFELTDQAIALSFEVGDYALGRMLGRTLGRTLGTGLLPLAGTALLAGAAYHRLPPAVRAQSRAGAAAGAQRWVHDHPEVVEHLANGAGGLVDGFWQQLSGQPFVGPDGAPALHATTEDAAGLLVSLYPDDAEADLRRLPSAEMYPDGDPVMPRSVEEMMRNLRTAARFSDADHPDHNGTFTVQTFGEGDGRRYLVYLPGTDDMTTLPWTRDGDVRDMPTNLAVVSGQETTYARAVAEALHEAGARPGQPVLVAGHSQGGIVAAYLAAHAAEHDLTITHAVTAGSPVAGQGPFGDGLTMLSLENQGDLIPLTDGEPNRDSPGHVTVRFDAPGEQVVDAHDLLRYVQGGAAVDASTDPSVRDLLADLATHGFLDGSEPTDTRVLQVTRTR